MKETNLKMILKEKFTINSLYTSRRSLSLSILYHSRGYMSYQLLFTTTTTNLDIKKILAPLTLTTQEDI